MKLISTRDYYDVNGILLIAKGVPMTVEMIEKLQKHTLAGKVVTTKNKSLKKDDYLQEVQALKSRFTGFEIQTLNYVSNILIDVIFKSKQTSWWMYVNALSNYIDWIYTHSIDVAIISMMMAVKLHYSEERLRELGLGALLHDIGKLLIPKRILQKTDTLNEVEKMILRQHCELGNDSMSGGSLSEGSKSIIIQHHERLDGSGYPNMLKSEQISEYAKIVMLADTLDTLTAGRPYKRTLETEETLRFLSLQRKKYSEEYLMILAAILT